MGGAMFYCKTCGNVGQRIEVRPGSGCLELLLWLFFLLPGIIYSIWRSNAVHKACPKCGSREMIPADSPLVPPEVRQAVIAQREQQAHAQPVQTSAPTPEWIKLLFAAVGIIFVLGVIASWLTPADHSPNPVATPPAQVAPANKAKAAAKKKVGKIPAKHSDSPSDACQQDFDNKKLTGMTREQVEASLGKPAHSVSYADGSETWTYAGCGSVIFDNGVAQ
jgi:hypothetical protein